MSLETTKVTCAQVRAGTDPNKGISIALFSLVTGCASSFGAAIAYASGEPHSELLESAAVWELAAGAIAFAVVLLISRTDLRELLTLTSVMSRVSFLGKSERQEQLLRYLIAIRWIAALGMISFSATAVAVWGLPRSVLLPLVLIAACIVAINYAFSYSLRSGFAANQQPVQHVALDLCLLTFFLHFSGGIENPFFFLYLLHVVIAGILLTRRDAYLVLCAAGLLVSLLVLGELFSLVEHYTIAIFPHPPSTFSGGEVHHAAHEPLFVLTRLFVFLVVLCLVGMITIALMAHSRRNELQLRVSARMTALGELVGYVAHEINNPTGVLLARTKLMLERLERPCSPNKFRADLETIDRHAQRLSGFTQRLLSFCRPSTEQKAPIRLARLMEESLPLIEDLVAHRRVRVQTEIDCRECEFLGNSKEIEQVLVNLVANALDAMTDRGTLRVICASRERGKQTWAFLTVEDSGCGIPSDNIPRLFDPFFSTKPPGEGTGLGLAVVHGIVSDHGGELSVSSVEGVGTAVEVSFPVIAS